jgi:hypothetical protein
VDPQSRRVVIRANNGGPSNSLKALTQLAAPRINGWTGSRAGRYSWP